ncbi:MAG TPA: hypothetical protein VF032_08850 [Thermoleophilaceae bacterium]
MGFMDRLREIFGGGGARAREPVETGDPSPGPAQKGTAATPAAMGDPAPGAVQETDPSVQSASATQTPEEQRQAAEQDPAASPKPGTEGQDQEPR